MTLNNLSSSARDKYRANFETAFGRSGCTAKSGSYIMRGGRLVPIEQAGKATVRAADSVHLKSEALSIHPWQIPEFEKFYAAHGLEGIKHDPRTGDCYIQDRKTKLKLLKARGFIDRDEICGGRSR